MSTTQNSATAPGVPTTTTSNSNNDTSNKIVEEPKQNTDGVAPATTVEQPALVVDANKPIESQNQQNNSNASSTVPTTSSVAAPTTTTTGPQPQPDSPAENNSAVSAKAPEEPKGTTAVVDPPPPKNNNTNDEATQQQAPKNEGGLTAAAAPKPKQQPPPKPQGPPKPPLEHFRDTLICRDLQKIVNSVFRHDSLKYRTASTLFLLLGKSHQVQQFTEDAELFGVVVGEFFFWFCETADDDITRVTICENIHEICYFIVEVAFPTAKTDDAVRWLCCAIYFLTFNNAKLRQHFATKELHDQLLAALPFVKSRGTTAKLSQVLLDMMKMSQKNQELFGTQEFYQAFAQLEQFCGVCPETNFVNALKIIEDAANARKWDDILNGKKSSLERNIVTIDNSLTPLLDRLGRASTLTEVKKAVDALALANKSATRASTALVMFLRKVPLFLPSNNNTNNVKQSTSPRRRPSPSSKNDNNNENNNAGATSTSPSPARSDINNNNSNNNSGNSNAPSPSKKMSSILLSDPNNKNDLVASCIGRFFNWFAQHEDGEKLCALGGTEHVLEIFNTIVFVGLKNATSVDSALDLVYAITNVTCSNLENSRILYSTTPEIVNLYTTVLIPHLMNFDEGARAFSTMMLQLLHGNPAGCFYFSQTTEFYDAFAPMEKCLKNKRNFVAVQQLLSVEVERKRAQQVARKKLEQKQDNERRQFGREEANVRIQDVDTIQKQEWAVLTANAKAGKEQIEEKEKQQKAERARIEKDESDLRKTINETDETDARKVIAKEIEKDKQRIADEALQLKKKKEQQDKERKEQEEQEYNERAEIERLQEKVVREEISKQKELEKKNNNPVVGDIPAVAMKEEIKAESNVSSQQPSSQQQASSTTTISTAEKKSVPISSRQGNDVEEL